MSTTSIRYCKRCGKDTIHVTTPKSGIVEKCFIGVVTWGMVPLIESMSPDKNNNRFMGSEVRCDVCEKLKEET